MTDKILIIRYAAHWNGKNVGEVIARPLTVETTQIVARDYQTIQGIEIVDLSGGSVTLDDDAAEALKSWDTIREYMVTPCAAAAAARRRRAQLRSGTWTRRLSRCCRRVRSS